MKQDRKMKVTFKKKKKLERAGQTCQRNSLQCRIIKTEDQKWKKKIENQSKCLNMQLTVCQKRTEKLH